MVRREPGEERKGRERTFGLLAKGWLIRLRELFLVERIGLTSVASPRYCLALLWFMLWTTAMFWPRWIRSLWVTTDGECLKLICSFNLSFDFMRTSICGSETPSYCCNCGSITLECGVTVDCYLGEFEFNLLRGIKGIDSSPGIIAGCGD